MYRTSLDKHAGKPCRARVSRRIGLSFRCLVVMASFVVVGAAADAANAQGVVQLPTYGTFSINSTIKVPDGGGALLGGVSRGAIGSNSRGVPVLGNVPYAGRLFRNRAIGRSTGGSTMSVHVTILDFEAMDKALLEEAARRQAARAADPRFDHPEQVDPDVQRKAEFLSRHLGKGTKRDRN